MKTEIEITKNKISVTEIPPLTCIGCQKRDEIIRILAEEVEKLQNAQKEETPVTVRLKAA